MEKINFEAGTIVTPAKVNEDKTITPAVWEGKTPLSPFMLNKLQENIENDQIEQNTVIDELKTKTIKCLQEVETPTPVSGTSIDINDSAEAKITELKISGNSEQETREGYNLLDFNVTQDKKVTVNDDGTITINGTGGFSLFFATVKFETKTYSIKWQIVSGTAIENSNHFIMIPGGTVWANKDVFTQFSFAEEKSYNSLWISAGVTFTNARIKIWIYEGTEEKPYEPYGASPSPDYPSEIKTVSGSVEINVVNKNWFKNYEKKEINNFGIKLNIDKNVLKFDGSVSSTNYPSFIFYADGSIKTNQFWAGKGNINGAKGFFDNNTINKVFSLFSTGTLSTTSSVKIRLTIGYETQLKNVDVYNFKNILSVLSDVNERINFIAIGFSPNTNVLLTASMQIETGTTATDFIEHQSQSIIMPVQQEMLKGDYFDFENEKEVHTYKKLTLTGEEITDRWTTQENGKWRFIISAKGIIRASTPTDIVEIFCNKLKKTSPLGTFKQVTGISSETSYDFMIIYIEECENMTIAEFKTYLKQLYDEGNPIIIYYKLAEPIDLEFTDEQKAVAKELNNARTYKNVTHIYSTDEISPVIEVTYKKDIETLFANALVESGV